MSKRHGKVKLEAEIFLMPKRDKIDASVYVHLKGYARAKVSHLDVEKPGRARLSTEAGEIFWKSRGLNVLLK